jgi:hypothetical protein
LEVEVEVVTPVVTVIQTELLVQPGLTPVPVERAILTGLRRLMAVTVALVYGEEVEVEVVMMVTSVGLAAPREVEEVVET